MKYEVHDGTHTESFTVEGRTLKECKEKAFEEARKRSWREVWSVARRSRGGI